MKINFKSKLGFTLVELLASVIVLVAISSIIMGIITSSLRGSNKTNTISTIRQNGDYALNQISKDIENSQPFDGQSTGLSTDSGNTYMSSCFVDSSVSPAPTPSVITLISVQPGDSIVKYVCSNSELSEIVNGTKISLIDPTVSLQSCSFSCTQNRITDVPIIKISFTLSSANQSKLVENNGSIVFENSVTLRNYKE